MTRLRINGVEEELAVATVAELLAARGIDPAARFLAVAVNGCRRAPRRVAGGVACRPATMSKSSARFRAAEFLLQASSDAHDRSAYHRRHHLLLAAVRRHRRLSEPAGAARLPRGERRRNGHRLDPPHQPRRLCREPGRSARRPLPAAAQHRRLRHRARRDPDRRAGARGARTELGQARADRRPRDCSIPMSSSWCTPPTSWCARALPCCPIATRTR